MWTNGKKQASPGHFDHGYNLEALGQHMDPDRTNRAALFMELIGDPAGKRILDLGGGTTMLGLMDNAAFYMVVDYSEVACGIVGRYMDFNSTHIGMCKDASEFLRTNRYPAFDITCCFGLMCYLPAPFLHELFGLAPSPVLCIAAPIGQGYLHYEGRISAYSLQDFKDAARCHKWKLTKHIVNPDHAQMRFEKR